MTTYNASYDARVYSIMACMCKAGISVPIVMPMIQQAYDAGVASVDVGDQRAQSWASGFNCGIDSEMHILRSKGFDCERTVRLRRHIPIVHLNDYVCDDAYPRTLYVDDLDTLRHNTTCYQPYATVADACYQ